jgi:hypothetical protein
MAVLAFGVMFRRHAFRSLSIDQSDEPRALFSIDNARKEMQGAGASVDS